MKNVPMHGREKKNEKEDLRLKVTMLSQAAYLGNPVCSVLFYVTFSICFSLNQIIFLLSEKAKKIQNFAAMSPRGFCCFKLQLKKRKRLQY